MFFKLPCNISLVIKTFIVLPFFLIACNSNDMTSSSKKATITISIGSAPQTKSALIPGALPSLARALPDELPADVTSIYIRVWRAGQLLTSADIIKAGGTLDLAVPIGVNLSVVGTAYANKEIIYQGEFKVSPLLAGENANVALKLVAFGPGAPGASQIDIVGGISGNGKSSSAFFYGDNGFVLFQSSADNLDQNRSISTNNNLFVKEIAKSDVIINVHTDNNDNVGNGVVGVAGINITGEFVVFASDADNLIDPGQDSNGVRDIFLKELKSNATTRISLIMDGTQAILPSYEPSISDDGSAIVFVSEAALLLDDRVGIFWLNRNNDTLNYVGTGRMPRISGDGSSLVAWDDIDKKLIHYQLKDDPISTTIIEAYDIQIATNRVPYEINQTGQQIVYGFQSIIQNPIVTRFSSDDSSAENPSTENPSNESEQDNGQPIDNPPNTTSTESEIYLYNFNINGNRTRLISLGENGVPVEKLHNSENPSVSRDAKFIAFTNDNTIYIKSTVTNALEKLSARGLLPSLSRDGSKIAFTAENERLYVIDNPIFESANSDPNTALSTLKISKLGNGFGFVASDSGDIACGEICAFSYPQGTLINLIATPDTDNIFTGWTGDCEIFGNITSIEFSVNTETNCEATFEATNTELVLSVDGGAGGGYILSDDDTQGIKQADCEASAQSTATCNAIYPFGETVTLLPTLNGNNDAIVWEGCDQDNGLAGCVVTLNEARRIRVTFIASIYRLIIEKTGSGSGSVSTENTSINCGDDCQNEYVNQSIVTLRALTDPNTTFSGWSSETAACNGNNPIITLTIDSDTTCTAKFNKQQTQFTLSNIGAGVGTVSSDPSGILCGTDCSQMLDLGSVITLTAVANDKSQFIAWGGACAGNETVTTLSLDVEKNCTAQFEILKIGLQVNSSGNGAGNISSEPSGINCGTDCSQSYVINTVVRLTAVPNNNSEFVIWAGACSGNNATTSVTIENIKSCNAEFRIKKVALTVSKPGRGAGTVNSDPTGIACGDDCAEDYDFDRQITLTAVPATNSVFVAWSGSCRGNTASTTVVINAAKNCVANFNLKQPLLSVNKNGTGSGTINSEPSGISCGNECLENYPFETKVTLKATAANDSNFVTWGGACLAAATGATTTVTMSEARTCSAEFNIQRRELSLTIIGSGTGAVTSEQAGINCGVACTAEYDFGTNITLTAVASSNSSFVAWAGDCGGTETRTSVTIDAVKNCTAEFGIELRRLTVNKTGTGKESGSVLSDSGGIVCGSDCSRNFSLGSVITLTANPSENAIFVAWAGDCNGTSVSTTVTLESSMTCSAEFTTIIQALTITPRGTGSGTVVSDPSGINCGNDCSKDFDQGVSVTLTATASNDSNFVKWSGDCGTSSDTTTINMSSAKKCTVEFKIKQRRLTITPQGTGSGKITSDPSGIDCGNDCKEDYNQGKSVNLTAAASSNSSFVKWGGDCSGSSSTTSVTMSSAKKCTAEFEIKQRKLTVTPQGTGSGKITSDPSGIDCGNDCKENYKQGKSVSLTAAASSNSNFVKWGGDCSGTSNTTSVTMSSAKKCTAEFKIKQRRLTVTPQGTGSGKIISDPSGIDCGNDCKEDYKQGKSVSLTAAASSNSNFIKWGGDCSGTSNTTSVTMSSAKKCTAEFVIKLRRLTITPGGTGSGTITSDPSGIDCGKDCKEDYNQGKSVNLTAATSSNSNFVKWGGDCSGSSSTTSVTMSSAKKCTAEFAIIQRRLTVAPSGTGSGKITSDLPGIDCGNDCKEDYNQGKSVSLTAAASSNSNFVKWGGDCSGSSSTTSVTMSSAKKCTAEFAIIQRRLTVAPSGTGSGKITSDPSGIDCGNDCKEDYNQGKSVGLTAAASSNSNFVKWGGDCSGSSSTTSVTMSSAKKCTAEFAIIQRRLTVAPSGTGSGTIISAPSGIDCGKDCKEDYDHGKSIRLTAKESSNSNFVKWGGNCNGSSRTTTVTMSSEKKCTAEFTKKISTCPDITPTKTLSVDFIPNFLTGNGKTQIKIRVENIGTGSAGLFYLQLVDGGNSDVQSIKFLAPNTSTTATFYLPYWIYNPDASFKMTTDYKNQIKECNEKNNSISFFGLG